MKFDIVWRSAMHGTDTKRVAFSQPQIAKFRATNAHGALKDGLEYGRKITSRRTDDFEHFRGRGLLLLEFTQLAIALVQLLVEGRRARAIERFALRTTFGQRRLFEPGPAAFALYAAKSFQCRPRAKNGLFSSLLQHGFGGLGTGATTAQGFVQRNKSAWSVRRPLSPRGYVTPPLGGGEPLARSATRGGRYRIVVDGGRISNTLFLPSCVRVL